MFTDRILDMTKEFESPEKFIYWSSLSAIAAVLGRNVYLDRFAYKLYPNIYVILTGPPSIRKGFPASITKKLVTAVGNHRVISGMNSIQGIINELSLPHTRKDQTELKEAVVLLASGEMASFLIDDVHSYRTLTDLYSTHEHEDGWNKGLKSGQESLKAPCINMLTACNESYFKEIIPDSAIKGGFIARTFIVLSSRKRVINPLTEKPKTELNYDESISYLRKVAKLRGEMTWSTTTKNFYAEWYRKFNERKSTIDVTGILERIHDQVLKVAMLISVSKRLTKVIEKKDIEEALDKCVDCITCMRRLIMGKGRSEIATAAADIINILYNRDAFSMRKGDLLYALWSDIDAMMLDKCIDTLSQAGLITMDVGKGIITYKLTAKAISGMAKFSQ